MPRFVLLYHECPSGYERPSHWDLMFESGGVLRTWSLAQLPCGWQSDPSLAAAGNTVDAEQLSDHRLAYLDYEGPVRGERGQVTRVAKGTFETVSESPQSWEIALQGERIRGRIAIERSGADARRWTLTLEEPA